MSRVVYVCASWPYSNLCKKKALDSDKNLLGRTRIFKENLLRLIQVCLNCNTFQYNGQLYKWLSGLPMCSPISVVLSELVMQSIAKKKLDNPPLLSSILDSICRWLSDCVTTWPNWCLLTTHQQHQRKYFIYFRNWKERNYSLPSHVFQKKSLRKYNFWSLSQAHKFRHIPLFPLKSSYKA